MSRGRDCKTLIAIRNEVEQHVTYIIVITIGLKLLLYAVYSPEGDISHRPPVPPRADQCVQQTITTFALQRTKDSYALL